MKNKLMKTVSKAKIMVMAAWLYIMVPLQLWANEGTSNLQLINGTEALLKDVQGKLLVIAVIVAVVLEIWNGVSYMIASEDEKPKYTKRVKTIIYTVVLILTAAETLTWLFGFYM